MSERSDAEDPGERKNFLPSGNDAFTCLACGLEVLPLAGGGFRSHCPACLWSRHVDRVSGDRASECGGLMEPIAVEGGASRGWSIVHECVVCGFRRRNKAALGDPRQPDAWDRIVEVSSRRPS